MKDAEMTDYDRFKRLLEYFVAYLEYCYHNPSSDPLRKTDTKGFDEYIKPLLPNKLRRRGQGWNGHHIQDPLKAWDTYHGSKIYFAADARNYTHATCYLTWAGTSYNIIARWDEGKIVALGQVEQKINDDGYVEDTVSLCRDVSVGDLGLFDGRAPNRALKNFYVNYYKSYNNDLYHELMSHLNAEKYIAILEKNRNLVLTGAPGTGKTHLARAIAQAMGACCEMVQFHPSYDYTDFVEGLRPTRADDNGNIGFKLTPGVFRTFCERALKSKTVDAVDNFEEAWAALVSDFDEKEYLEVPLLSGNGYFRVELNEYGTGLANRTYEDDTFHKQSWIRGKSKFFNKEQLYNIYRGLNGIPSGGHDNYRKAIVKVMKENYGLKDYQPGIEAASPRKYVFIIDEINRGELSKIFGELFFSIDPEYRGLRGAVKTQYANMYECDNAFDEVLHRGSAGADHPGSGWFFIPDNVYIIGTMNDIDRSVEAMDFALRRRFRWCEIRADEMQDEMGLSGEAKRRMGRLNAEITGEHIGLPHSYCIGAAYFKGAASDSDFADLWEQRLEGLLYEYFRGMDDADEKLRRLKTAYNSGAQA